MKRILGLLGFILLFAGCATQSDERIQQDPIIGVVDGKTSNGSDYLQSVKAANAEHIGEEASWVNTGKAN